MADHGVSAGPVSAAAPAPAVGPRIDLARTVWPVFASPFDAAQQEADKPGRVNAGPNVALMGVGAATVVIGLLVGGDSGTLIALGGGVIGLVGFYRFLK